MRCGVCRGNGCGPTYHVMPRYILCRGELRPVIAVVRGRDGVWWVEKAGWGLLPQQMILEAMPTMVDVKGTAIVGAVAPGNIYVIDVAT